MVKNLSKSRWTERAESIKAVWNSYDCIIDTLNSLKEWGKLDRDSRCTASDLSEKMVSVDLYLTLVFMINVMYKTKLAVTEVQKVNFDIMSGLEVMRQTAESMERMRNDDKSLDGLIDLAIDQCQKHDIDCVYEFNRRHRPRRPPGRIDDAPKN